jgi:hypothetical protein
MTDKKKDKGAVNPPAVNSPGYDQHEYLDTDVAGHEENFEKDADAAVNKRAEAEAQIAANLAENSASEQPGTGGPEKGQPDTSPDALEEKTAKPKRAPRKADTDK